MNNIYVDELPKSCIDCPCESESYCNLLNIGIDIREHIVTPNCPLKLITDRLAEERKKVVQELKSWCDKNFNWIGDGTGFDGQEYNEMIGSNNTINKLREKLDQIERSE